MPSRGSKTSTPSQPSPTCLTLHWLPNAGTPPPPPPRQAPLPALNPDPGQMKFGTKIRLQSGRYSSRWWPSLRQWLDQPKSFQFSSMRMLHGKMRLYRKKPFWIVHFIGWNYVTMLKSAIFVLSKFPRFGRYRWFKQTVFCTKSKEKFQHWHRPIHDFTYLINKYLTTHNLPSLSVNWILISVGFYLTCIAFHWVMLEPE